MNTNTSTVNATVGAGRADRAGSVRHLLRGWFGIVGRRETYRQLGYLVLGLPLGTIWFSALVSAVATGIGLLAVALLGVPIMLGTWYLVRAFANVERATANTLVGTRLPIAPAGPHGQGNPWRRLRALSNDHLRRRELRFLILRFPVGIATFTVATILLAVPLAIAYAPFTARYEDDGAFGSWEHSDHLEQICESAWAWGLVPLGALMLVGGLHAASALARVCARWTTGALTA